tara:strand:+ start:2070 stop:3749 length:1680 start_codon:yes stop_codon:yes gene_type:complete
MSILSVDNISPIGSGATVSLNAIVGINTDASGNGSGGKLVVGGRVQSNAGGYWFAGANGAEDGWHVQDYNGNFTVVESGVAERIRIDSSGRVMMGTTAASTLTSCDDLTISTSGSTGITLFSAAGNAGNIAFGDGTSGDDRQRGLLQYHHSDDTMRFFTNAARRMTITSDGILIINQTSASGTKLAIQSTASSGSGTATGIRVGNNIGALTQYPANIEVRTTGVASYNAIRTDAGDGNGGFTCGVETYHGFLDLTTGGSNTVNVKLRASGASYINGGDLLIGRTSSGAHSNANELQIGSGSGTSGLTIFSANTDGGSIYYADGTSGDARYRGFLEYYHASDSLAIGIAGDEKFRFALNGSNGDLRFDIGTGQQAQIAAMSGNGNTYNLGSSGGAAIRFMDTSGSHTIEFDTHWTGNSHATALKIGRTGSLIMRDNRNASIGRDYTSGTLTNGQSVNWNGSGATLSNGRLNANSIGGNGGGHITCLSVSSQDGNPSGAQIITGVHGQGFNTYVTHASNFDSGISVTFNGTWTISNSSGETIYYRINVIHMGTSTTTYYGR